MADTAEHHPTQREIVATLSSIAPEAGDHGVTLAIENHDRLPAATLLGIFRCVDRRAVGLCFDTANSLGAKTDAALRSHQREQHATEWNQLGAFINELEAQRGKSIDPVTADRFIAFAQDLIARLG